MRIEIQLRIIGDDNSVINADEVLHLDKSDDQLEAIGLSFSDEGHTGRRPGAGSVRSRTRS